ncbi:MAG TPA: SirA family protein [Coriobacteriia bacterium]|nr:SirA family protein [Coriobacteriia bacterium]
MIQVDASGLSCPEPLMLLKKALDELGSDGKNEILLLVDNKTALENCERLAKKKGYTVGVEDNDGTYRLHIRWV